MEKPSVLVIDTSTSNLKIALSINGKDVFIDEQNSFNHIEKLIVKIDECFKTAGADRKDLEYAGICNGPGSFTGIRIGIATLLGITYALKIKSFGFSVFDIYEFLSSNNENSALVPVIDAKKNRFYCSIISHEIAPEMYDITVEELISKVKSLDKKIIFAGKDFSLIKDRLDFKYEHVFDNDYSSSDMLNFAAGLILSKSELTEPAPIYLRKSEAEIMLMKKYEK